MPPHAGQVSGPGAAEPAEASVGENGVQPTAVAGGSLSLSGMSRIVSRLEAQGLVARERASCDGRGLNAVLTGAGLGRLRRAWPTHLASVRRHMMDHLGELDLPGVTAAMQRFASGTPCAGPRQEV